MLSKIINAFGSICIYWRNLAVRLNNSGGPLVTYLIITVCTFVFLRDNGFTFYLPDLVRQPFAIIGYQFTHHSFGHLFGNMLFLMLFGPPCEKYLGHLKFLTLFLLSGIISALGFAAIWNEAHIIGASGAISGLLATYPFVQERFYERVFAVVVCTTYFWLQVLSTIQDIQAPLFASVAHFAHIIGGAAGLICFVVFLRPEINLRSRSSDQR